MSRPHPHSTHPGDAPQTLRCPLTLIASKLFPLSDKLKTADYDDNLRLLDTLRRIPSKQLLPALACSIDDERHVKRLNYTTDEIIRALKPLATLEPASKLHQLAHDAVATAEQNKQIEAACLDLLARLQTMRPKLDAMHADAKSKLDRVRAHRAQAAEALTAGRLRAIAAVKRFREQATEKEKRHLAAVVRIRKERLALANELTREYEARVRAAAEEAERAVQRRREELLAADAAWTDRYAQAHAAYEAARTSAAAALSGQRVAAQAPPAATTDASPATAADSAPPPLPAVLSFSVVRAGDLSKEEARLSVDPHKLLMAVRAELSLGPDERFAFASLDPVPLAAERRMTAAAYAAQTRDSLLIIAGARDPAAPQLSAPVSASTPELPSAALAQSTLPFPPATIPALAPAPAPSECAAVAPPASATEVLVRLVCVTVSSGEVKSAAPLGEVAVPAVATLSTLRDAIGSTSYALPAEWRFLSGVAPVAPAKEKTMAVSAVFVHGASNPNTVWVKEKV